ncbi:hypothetical protein K466DRAFT_606244 [Polyporus arcularius HHB13444]|uniref:CxC2-like cysteine cluster KDZ transposase-associated domain-containing protein n=1 Tax=Polyporus arcularius HHB13444 TaxID=1314778 RepID=A0A5C3NNT7_9APHY|nr:hypothetical protein K466DRAFT_606244 [Polyporus arcularius HHB13444]
MNLPNGWEDDPEKFKYIRSVMFDGYFGAQHLPMKNPEDDVSLADGHAFTVRNTEYKRHLGTAVETPETSTCNDHRAVLNAAVSHGKYEATGIGVAACTRHGFFQPHSCVDFQLGEKQRNIDWILHWILAFLNGLSIVLVCYDIMCQYFVHLRERFEKSPHLHMPAGLQFLRGIGQFHVHGHLTRCFPRFSLNFIKGAGVQDGEILETLWNKVKGIADSTRGMGLAHRHELIDDRMNDSNWTKLTRIVPLLNRRWKRVCTERQPAVDQLNKFNQSTSEQERQEWLADAEHADAARSDDVDAMDIYDVHSKPLPTKKDVELRLAGQELEEEDLSTAGEAAWLTAGLRLEERKLSVAYVARHLGVSATPSQKLDLVKQRQKLSKSILAFHKAAPTYIGPQTLQGYSMPDDRTDFGADWDSLGEAPPPRMQAAADPLQPEHQALALPSTFRHDFLRSRGLTGLAAKEWELRIGQMNDSLQAIRNGIGYKSMLFRKKVRGATSTKAKLRSFDEVHVADETIRKHVRVYTQARRAASLLFIDDDTRKATFLAKYKPITRDDLKASTTVLEAYTPGLRDKHEAWFWTIEDNEQGKSNSWTQSCECRNHTVTPRFQLTTPYVSSKDALAEGLRTHAKMDGGEHFGSF